jgi:sulfur dioxygenase
MLTMLFKELNRSKCKTYLVGCENTKTAALIDPLKEHIDLYVAVLAYYHLALELIIDTHTHADHRSGTFELKDLLGGRVVMHRRAPAPRVDIHVDEGDSLTVGELKWQVLYTPGHTADGISLSVGDRVFTGDTLLIGGTGRADFAGGDAGAEYDSIVNKLFKLPDQTIVFPAHDYRGHTCSSIGAEKSTNLRLVGRSRADYIHLMNNLGLPLPDKIQEALQPNQSALDDDFIKFPALSQLNQVQQLEPSEVARRLNGFNAPIVVDVREPDEFNGELGHIHGSRLMPLRALSEQASQIEQFKSGEVVTVCRAGVRSTTAAAILTALGFEHVFNLKGGMLDWNDAGLPVQR